VACSRWRVSRTLAIVLLCGWAPLLWALDVSTSNEYELNISTGSLIEAIKQFSEQTDVQVTVDSQATEVDVLRLEGFQARLSARAALARILAGSSLSTDWQGEHTVRIYPGVVLPPEGDGGQRIVEVTGTRLGGGEGPAPVRVYDREDIERSGVSSVPGLADYFTQQPFSFAEWAQRSSAQHFQMRGLGVDTTLVLINGRRAPPSATSVSLNAFDLNTIPLTAVDRIEVMSDSASAIYGADAIGGVVNIILKGDFESPDFYFHYGAAAGGGEERRFAGAIGHSEGRFKSSLVLDYFERDMLVGAKREMWRDQDFRRFGGEDYRLTAANPANVYATTGGVLPGLPTSHASVPVGSSGIGLAPEDFLTTAGVESRDSSNRTWSIVPDTTRLSAFGSAEFSLSGHSSIFGEVLLTESDIVSQNDLPFLLAQIVPATNPYNPFGEPVAVDYSLVGMRPIANVTESQLGRFVVGARGRLRPGWDWELTLTSSDERVDAKRVHDVDPYRVEAALESRDPQTALNPFADGPGGGDALLSSLVADPQVLDSFSGGLQFSGFLRGKLFHIPGGWSEFVAGAEWRREDIKYINIVSLEHQRDVTSAFAEIRLPVVDQVMIKLALRGDYYENASDAVNPQYGVVWRPSANWLVRAAYGTSFRPPSLSEQFSPRSEVVFAMVDPRRGGAITPVRFSAGGNPDLDNVSAESFTAGLMYRPDKSPGLHLGAHYWRVVMDNRIIVPRFSSIQTIEDALPGRVIRAAPTEADRLAGWPGSLQAIDVSVANFGRLETSGIDLDLSYGADWPTGRTQAALSATWVNEYESQEVGTNLPVNRVGIANLQGTIPEWRLVGSLMWHGDGWGASTTATFTPRYRDTGPSGVLDRHLPSRTLIDMQAWLELGRMFDPGVFDGLKITAGALNVFDREVDFANAGSFLGYDVSQANLRQRFAYVRITKAF
jgi:iron complex outermembrane receptor protein